MKSICENVSSLDGIRWVCSTNFGSYAASTQDFNGCAEKKKCDVSRNDLNDSQRVRFLWIHPELFWIHYEAFFVNGLLIYGL